MLEKASSIAGYFVEDILQTDPIYSTYKVKHSKLESVHLCKLLHTNQSDNPQIRTAYTKEMRWLSEIRNPFLIRITDVLDSKQGVGIVSDWMDGSSLVEHLQKYKMVDFASATRWIAQILSALHPLHAQGKEHLEIYPQNLFLEKQESGFIAILLDYGIESRLVSSTQNFSPSIGRLRYCAPEQIKHSHLISMPADVYSVGVVLYELLTGKNPFPGDIEYNVMHSIVEGRYAKLHLIAPELPKELCDIVEKSMSMKPQDRYANAREMLEAIYQLAALPSVQGAWDVGVELPPLETPAVSVVTEKEEELLLQKPTKRGAIPKDDRLNRRVYDVSMEDSEEEEEEAVSVPPSLYHSIATGIAQGMGYASRYIWRIVLGTIVLVGLVMVSVVFWKGRPTEINITNHPEWGMLFVQLDGEEPHRKQHIQQNLSLGTHPIAVDGGMFYQGNCNRCCWNAKDSIDVPFGLQDMKVDIDISTLIKPQTCPTSELDFYFSEIPPTTVTIGFAEDIPLLRGDEMAHTVSVTRKYWISKYEVTQQLYEKVMGVGSNPSQQKSLGTNVPVDSVSWLDAVRFCNALSALENVDTCYQIQGDTVLWESGVDCKGYRLPTEAEWEIAARGDSPLVIDGKTRWYAGGGNPILLAWFASNSHQHSHEVGVKYPNDYGLYDMSGNVSEWVWDIYGMYDVRDVVNPKGPNVNTVSSRYQQDRVIRGGNFLSPQHQLRLFTRDYANASLKAKYIGFRIVRGVP